MGYWENRQAKEMYESMESAEAVSKEIADIYAKASRELNYQIENIYERFRDKHKLTDAEARQLLNTMRDKTDIAELKRRLAASPKDADLLAEMESSAFRARIERLQNMQAEVDRIMQNVYQQEKRVSTAHYIDTAQKSYYRQIYDIQRQVGFQFAFAACDPRAINLVLASNWSGENYSRRIWNNTQGVARDLKEQMILGLITGKTEREMAKELAGRYATGAFEARRLVRTESNYVNGQMQLQAYDECGADQYEFVATLDLRTSEQCRELDGQIFKVKDAVPGVNMNPMHPFCRSTTIIHLDNMVVDGLKRRARNPETGKHEFVPASMNYRQWYKKNVQQKGLTGLDKVRLRKEPAGDKIKTPERVPAEKVSIDTFPAAFKAKAEAKATQALIDFINGQPAADPNVVKLYNSMGKMENLEGVDFKISHAKKHSVSYTYYRSSGKYAEVKLTIPKLTPESGPGAAHTVLHENMHLIDLYLRENPDSIGHFRDTAKALEEAVAKSGPDIGKRATDLFAQYKEELRSVRQQAKTFWEGKISELTDQYYPDGVDIWADIKKYKRYEKERKKLYTQMEDDLDARSRSAMGGGIGELQDIYDALSGGRSRDTGLVQYGHGSEYYRTMDAKKAEIIANYGALSVARPDLVEILREDKPDLVAALEQTIEAMVQKVR